MSEQADESDLKSAGSITVWVQIPLPAPIVCRHLESGWVHINYLKRQKDMLLWWDTILEAFLLYALEKGKVTALRVVEKMNPHLYATVSQLVEGLICNQDVVSSSLTSSSSEKPSPSSRSTADSKQRERYVLLGFRLICLVKIKRDWESRFNMLH